jgi:hypothetical protein
VPSVFIIQTFPCSTKTSFPDCAQTADVPAIITSKSRIQRLVVEIFISHSIFPRVNPRCVPPGKEKGETGRGLFFARMLMTRLDKKQFD